MRIRAWPLLLTLAALCACAPPETISGRATVTDGDSLEIAGTRIRLHAVDAPEARQACRRNGGAWRCGVAAKTKLASLTHTRDVRCTKTEIDSYGRTVAICHQGPIDVGAEMVRAGLALAYRQYGTDYVPEEDEARAARRGMWAGEFTAPWDWRHDPQPEAAPAPAQERASEDVSPDVGSCPIKGNVSQPAGERIYHVPGSRSYDETIIDPLRGERMFCSEEEARRAGWRAPRG